MAEAKFHGGGGGKRPLSPHLQVYKPIINMVMSILHRITGAVLYAGSLLLCWWLTAAAAGPEYFDYVNGWFGTIAGKVVLFGYSWALINHGLGGIRHFIWDTGRGFDLETIDWMSWGSLLASLVLTAVLWIYIIGQRGGL